MMKRNILAVVIPALLVAGAANAAEVYNKDGNKLDVYGKTVGLHYFSDNAGNDGDQTYARLGFKGKLRLIPICPVTVSGNTTLPVTTLKAAATLRTVTKPVWHLPV